jgi:phospholipase/carboxylesterase
MKHARIEPSRRRQWARRVLLFASCVWALGLLGACKSAPSASQSAAAGSPDESTTLPVQQRAPTLSYVTFTTAGGADDEPLPWIVGLHGLGDRPEAFVGLFRSLPFRAHVYVPRAPLPFGSGFDWFGVRVGGDSRELSQAIQRASNDLVRLLDELGAGAYNTGKPAVTGFSQGGMLSFALAARHPDRVEASLPIGGWLPPPFFTALGPRGSAGSPPILAFHGEQDDRVPLQPTLVAVAELSRRGFDVNLQRYPGLGHAISPELQREWSAALQGVLRATR